MIRWIKTCDDHIVTERDTCPQCEIENLRKLNKNLERQFVEDTAKIQELENLLSGGGPREVS